MGATLEGGTHLSSRQAKQSNSLARLRTFQQSVYRLLTDPAFEPLFDVVIVAENKVRLRCPTTQLPRTVVRTLAENDGALR